MAENSREHPVTACTTGAFERSCRRPTAQRLCQVKIAKKRRFGVHRRCQRQRGDGLGSEISEWHTGDVRHAGERPERLFEPSGRSKDCNDQIVAASIGPRES